jgi:hypothetical protein
MSLQKEMLHEIARVINEHEPYRIDEWFTEDFKLVEPTKPDWPRGNAGATVSRHTMLVDLTKTIRSVRHQCRFGHRRKHTTCRPAKNKFP